MRKLILIAATAASAFALTACSEKTQDAAGATAESAGDDVANAADKAAAATDELGDKAANAVDNAAAATDEMADKAAAKTKQEAAEAEASLHNESVAEAKKD
ncbi:MAG: entericidin EcnAB [Novosphingobium sp.]|nr:entericidin EcnAB [Novosphingobium sp.]